MKIHLSNIKNIFFELTKSLLVLLLTFQLILPAYSLASSNNSSYYGNQSQSNRLATQYYEYKKAADDAEQAGENNDILWKVWAAVSGICLTMCMTSLAGASIFGSGDAWVCSGASLGAGITDAAMTKEFTGLLMGAAPMVMGLVMGAATAGPIGSAATAATTSGGFKRSTAAISNMKKLDPPIGQDGRPLTATVSYNEEVPTQRAYWDSQGRAVRTDTFDPSGNNVIRSDSLDANGNAITEQFDANGNTIAVRTVPKAPSTTDPSKPSGPKNPETKSNSKNWSACLAAAIAAFQAYQKHQAMEDEFDTADENKALAQRLLDQNNSIPRNVTGGVVYVTPGGGNVGGTAVGGTTNSGPGLTTTSNAADKKVTSMSESICNGAKSRGVQAALNCAISSDRALPDYVRPARFQKDFKKTSGIDLSQFFKQDFGGGAQGIAGAMGGALNPSQTKKLEPLLAAYERKFTDFGGVSGTHYAGGGGGGGSASTAEKNDIDPNALVSSLLDQIMPQQEHKGKKDTQSGTYTALSARDLAGMSENRQVSLFERVSNRYQFVMKKILLH
ncbi:MAG: hypothetical protein HY072_03480 [Deltaproteobacteria bacterium]|nr:hypothetical protein [Deltaproteobacteria bacterium]